MLTNCSSKVGLFVFATFIVAILIAPAAKAVPITYNFTVSVTSGPLAWTSDHGTFSYDSSSIIPNGLNPDTGLLTGLDFNFDGVKFNATTANTGWLAFNPFGSLTSFAFGTNCSAASCTITGFGNNLRWFLVYDQYQSIAAFSYSIDNEYYGGNFTLARAAVPELPCSGYSGWAWC